MLPSRFPRMAGTKAEHRFRATVRPDGVNFCVDVPAAVAGALQAVHGRVLLRTEPWSGPDAGERERLERIGRWTSEAGGWFRTTLVPRRDGPTRLFLDRWMRSAAGGAGAGDAVGLVLRPDEAPRDVEVPEALLRALDAEPRALEAWAELSPSRRREVCTYLHFLRSEEALQRNVRTFVGKLLG